jgi:hypothetical protein
MGRFIAYSGRTATVTDIYDLMLERLLRAYVLFIGLPFILNYAGDTIYKHKTLRTFFEHWEMALNYFKTREAQRWSKVDSGDWTPYRDKILAVTGYNKELYDKFNPRQSLLNVERYKCGRLLQMTAETATDIPTLTNLIETTLKGTDDPSLFFYMQPESVPLVSVFIGLDMAIIIANIYTMEIYRKGITIRKQNEDIPAWIDFQSARMSVTTGETGKQYFDKQGKLTFTIPMMEKLGRVAEFNTYGLKFYLDISKMPVSHVFTETWTWLITEPPDMSFVWLETWRELEYQLFFTEEWTHSGGFEPPEMELYFSEPWGVVEWVLIYTEQWTAVLMPWGYGYIIFKEKWG